MLTTLITALTLLFTAFPAFSRVTDLYAPSTAVAGQNITVVLGSEGYIQNWNDFGVIWGLKNPAAPPCGDCVGTEIGYETLYENTAVGLVANTSFQVAIPKFQSGGDYLFVAAVPHLVGAVGGVAFRFWNSSITITVPSS